jgi:ketosteroid isomerase-like protein
MSNVSQPTPSLAAETETVREAYAALNRNDIPAMLNAFDPQIERIEPPEFPMGGTYRGHAELEAHLSKARATWAEGACEPERFVVAGDKIVAFLAVRVRRKDRTDWTEGRLADVFTFRDGKAIQWRSFAESHQALAWAGATAPDAS